MAFDFLKRLFRTETRSLENPATPISFDFLTATPTDSGVVVTERTALNIAAVYQAVNVLANDVSKLPLFLYRRLLDGGRERDKAHPTSFLLRHKPNQYLTSVIFKKTLMQHALLWGNGYAAIFRDGAARPIELIILDPSRTYPVWNSKGELRYITTINNERRTLFPEDVFHLRGLAFDGIKGYSPVELARNSLALGVAAEKFGNKFFSNGAVATGVLSHPGVLKGQAAENLREEFEEKHRGLGQTLRTIVLQEGVKFQQLTIPNEAAQFLQTREFQKAEVASWFNLPPHKVGAGDRTSYASLEQENQSYLDASLDPWLIAFEEECWDKLLTEEEKHRDTHFVEFLRDALLRTDLPTRYESYATGIQWGILSPNEARRLENKPPRGPEGDEFVRPVNMAPAGTAANALPTADPQAKANVVEAQRMLLSDAIGRMYRRIANTTRQAAKNPAEFRSRINRELEQYEAVFAQAIQPTVAAIRLLSGNTTLSAPMLARDHVAKLRAALSDIPPEQVETLASRWETTGADALADNILGIAL